MIWREFKKLVEDAGVENDMKIDWIGEIDWNSVDDVEVHIDEENNSCEIQPL